MNADAEIEGLSALSAPYAFEAAVVAFIIVVFLIVAATTLRARHRDTALWHVLLGAGVYGAIVGLVIAFIVLPLRIVLMNAETPPEVAALGGVAVFLMMFALRRGAAGRLPFLGAQIKAFRRAQLRKTIETAEKQLAALGGAVGCAEGDNPAVGRDAGAGETA